MACLYDEVGEEAFEFCIKLINFLFLLHFYINTVHASSLFLITEASTACLWNDLKVKSFISSKTRTTCKSPPKNPQLWQRVWRHRIRLLYWLRESYRLWNQPTIRRLETIQERYCFKSPNSVCVFASAFLVKLPTYGIHLWLPKAHVEAKKQNFNFGIWRLTNKMPDLKIIKYIL